MCARLVRKTDDDETGELEAAAHGDAHGGKHMVEVYLLLDLLEDFPRAALRREGERPAAGAVEQIGHFLVEYFRARPARHLPSHVEVAPDQLSAKVDHPFALDHGGQVLEVEVHRLVFFLVERDLVRDLGGTARDIARGPHPGLEQKVH